jgi:hypothetical protein
MAHMFALSLRLAGTAHLRPGPERCCRVAAAADLDELPCRVRFMLNAASGSDSYRQ